MSSVILFACSKCFSRHPFEELSEGTQLCKSCRGSTSIMKCGYCRSEFLPHSKTHTICKKCEYNFNKYGKPGICECCKIVAAFGGSTCMRCSCYESKYGPPVQCDECKLRSAFDRRDENKKVNGKILCWLCTCAYKRALAKAQQDGRLLSKKRSHDKLHHDYGNNSSSTKKLVRLESSKSNNNSNSTTTNTTVSNIGADLPEIISRNTTTTGPSTSGGNGSLTMGLGITAPPALINSDVNSSDYVVVITTLKERIATLERRLVIKDKELLEKDKMLTEIKSINYEKEIEMRNKTKENDRLHEMKVENLNRKVASLLREIAGLKKSYKRNGTSNRDKRESEIILPKEETTNTNATTTTTSAPITERNENDKEGNNAEKSKKINQRASVGSATKKGPTRNTGDNKPVKVKKTDQRPKKKDNNNSRSQLEVNEPDNNSVIKDSDCSRSGTHTSSTRSSTSRSITHSRSTSRSKSVSYSQSESNSRSQSQTPTNIMERLKSSTKNSKPSRTKSINRETMR